MIRSGCRGIVVCGHNRCLASNGATQPSSTRQTPDNTASAAVVAVVAVVVNQPPHVDSASQATKEKRHAETRPADSARCHRHRQSVGGIVFGGSARCDARSRRCRMNTPVTRRFPDTSSTHTARASSSPWKTMLLIARPWQAGTARRGRRHRCGTVVVDRQHAAAAAPHVADDIADVARRRDAAMRHLRAADVSGSIEQPGDH